MLAAARRGTNDVQVGPPSTGLVWSETLLRSRLLGMVSGTD
jgi:hypothetical protein